MGIEPLSKTQRTADPTSCTGSSPFAGPEKTHADGQQPVPVANSPPHPREAQRKGGPHYSYNLIPRGQSTRLRGKRITVAVE